MDVTPQLIEQIDFSEKFRGYDPDQVDEFLERVGATIVELNNRLAAAETRATEAEASAAAAAAVRASDQLAPAPTAVAAPAMSDEEEAAAATSTLMLAKRTADAAIADARAEAARHLTEVQERAERELADAQAEAARLVADATSHAEDLASRAVAEAEAEHGRRRDLIMVEITELESRRSGLIDGVTALERRSAEHRSSLEHMITLLRGVLDDPEALVEPDAGPDGTAPVVEATASEVSAPAPAAEPATEPVDAAPADAPPPPVSAEPDESPAPADADDVAPSADVAEAAPATTTVDEPTMAHPYVEVDDDDVVTDAPTAPADTWGPGSWSEVAAVVDSADSSSTPTESDPPPPPSIFDSVPGADSPVAAVDTGATQTQSRDRYLQDLDEAVNAEDGSHDEAMAAFFEGEEKPAPRRFGRRR